LWLYDIHLLARRLDARERAEFVAFTGGRRIRKICNRGLMLAYEAFRGIDRQWIASLATVDELEVGDKFLEGGLSRFDILMEDLAALPWLSRLQLLHEHMFPSRRYMYQRFGTRQPLALPLLYLRRAVSGAPRWFRRYQS
jgi:hypothetical protein